MSEISKNNMSTNAILEYKKYKNIALNPEEKKQDKHSAIMSSFGESLDMMKVMLPIALTVFGVMMAFPQASANWVFMLVFLFGFLVIAEIIFVVYSYVKFSKKVYKKNYDQISFEIKLEDYIVNMIDLLLEYKDFNNKRLIFAVGMNETALEKILEEDKSINTESFVSVCHDFIEFMGLLGIDAIQLLHDDLINRESVPKKGSVFTLNFNITQAKDAYEVLNGTKFTAIFYVNSKSANGEFGVGKEDIEDGRESVFHLIDALSDYIYKEKKGTNLDFILMIPAIGAGKTGKAPYKNILIEIINCLSISGYATPDLVVLSLRDYELFDSKYEASSILRLAKKILATKD